MSKNYYDYKPIGERIKTARKKKGLTQEKLSEILDLTPNHISEIERGISGVAIPTLMNIIKHLDTTADYILYGRVVEENGNPLYTKLKQFSPAQMLAVEKMIEVFAEYCNENIEKE
ncbi:MAG: helix-turn-helix transcriptional regulator [Clostridia bacterium]|nr:helix-turn-helix transcriptional regulator [Clostridia bacterium]